MIDNMKTFRMVVESNGFRAAATELNLSPAMVSRRIDKLEFELKTQLLKRNTRVIKLTEAGEYFYRECISIIDTFESCRHEMKSLNDDICGRLKVGIPHSINQLHVIPAINHFRQSYPNVILDIITGNHCLELFSHGYDLAIHCGQLPDCNLYYTLLGYWKKHTCISPEYAECYGIPTHPNQLHNHQCLLHFDNSRQSWRYIVDGQPIDIPLSGKVKISNSLDLYQMGLHGEGVVYLPDFTVTNALASGELISILEPFMPPPLPMYMVHINPQPSPKEQAFIDFFRSLNLAANLARR